jgi:hypothetical protein
VPQTSRSLRGVVNAAINSGFAHMPEKLITARHERRHLSRVTSYLGDDPFFIHVPKSGGQSVQKAIGQDLAGHFTYRRLIQLDPRFSEKESYLSILRDPVERLVSTYFYIRRVHESAGTTTLPRVARAPSLDAFLVDVLPDIRVEEHYFLRSASTYYEGADPRRLMILNFDRLAEAFAEYSRIHLPATLALPHVNATARSRAVVSAEGRAVVESLYLADVTLWSRMKERPIAALAELNESQTA